MLKKFVSIPDKAGLKEKLRSSNTFGAYVKLIIFSRGNKTTWTAFTSARRSSTVVLEIRVVTLQGWFEVIQFLLFSLAVGSSSILINWINWMMSLLKWSCSDNSIHLLCWLLYIYPNLHLSYQTYLLFSCPVHCYHFLRAYLICASSLGQLQIFFSWVLDDAAVFLFFWKGSLFYKWIRQFKLKLYMLVKFKLIITSVCGFLLTILGTLPSQWASWVLLPYKHFGMPFRRKN